MTEHKADGTVYGIVDEIKRLEDVIKLLEKENHPYASLARDILKALKDSVPCRHCYRCAEKAAKDAMDLCRMFLCETCGNKRCPHATDHRLTCTSSNEPGQKGSMYE